MMHRWDVVRAFELIERERIQLAGGVPTIAWQLIEHPAREKYDLSSIEAIAYGGAPSAPDLVRKIREVFGAGEKCPPLSATKSLSGHSLGAAGVQEAIYSLIMMENQFICESANITEIDPAFADMNIIRKRIDNRPLGTVLSNSFGFGGTNASLVFKHIDA